MVLHPTFWSRTGSRSLKDKDLRLQEIWQVMEESSNDLDLLTILYKLSKLIGK